MFKMEFILDDEKNQIKVTVNGEIHDVDFIYMYNTLISEANNLKRDFVSEVTEQLIRNLNITEETAKKRAEDSFDKFIKIAEIKEKN